MNTDLMLLVAAEWIGAVALGMLVSLSPAVQKIRPLQFLFPRREASITFALNAAIFIFSILLYKSFFTLSSEFAVIDLEAGWQRIILDFTILLVMAAALVTRRQPVRSALWSKEGLRSGFQFGLLMAVMTIFIRAKISTIINGIGPAEGMALLQSFLIAFCEVTVFFGFSQPRLSARFGSRTGWLMSAALYALWQIIPLALHGASGSTALFQVILAVGQGLILGWITPRSRHVLGLVIYLALSQWLFLIK